MKITIIFPVREVEMGKAIVPVMPLAPTLLAALTPDVHYVTLVDMFYGDTGHEWYALLKFKRAYHFSHFSFTLFGVICLL